jgi:glycosyltransferase involved in cell wall biosynthesis
MRIRLLTPLPPRSEAPGAIPLVLHAQLIGLRKRHDVTLVTIVGDDPDDAAAVSDLRRSGLAVHAIDGRRPHGLGRWRRRWRFASSWGRRKMPWRTIWFADPRIQTTLDRLTNTEHFDLAAVEDNSMAVFRFPRHLPTVLTEHEVRRPRPISWEYGPPKNWLRWALGEEDWRRWPAYQRSSWRRFDRIQVFSHEDATILGQLAPDIVDKVRVTPFGIVLPEPADPQLEQRGLILFVGNFYHPPNVDAVVWLVHDIMPRLRSRTPGVRLRIVGGGAGARVLSLGGQDVEILGEVPTMLPHLAAASVVLAPIRTGGGMRMKVLTALAHGKAVVTTQRGAAGLALGHGPPLVVGEDPTSLALATARLLDDDAARRQLGARARAYVMRYYSAEAYGRRLEAVYHEVARHRDEAGGTADHFDHRHSVP